MLYEAWTGRHPFRGANAFVTSDHILHEAAPPASTLRAGTPAGLDGLLDDLLAKEPAARPASAATVLGLKDAFPDTAISGQRDERVVA